MHDKLLPELDPAMLPPSTRLQRRFAHESLRVPYIGFLEDRLRRDPRDLRAHVERVAQRVAVRDAAGCEAALVDLFIALGPGGRTLRERLLDSAAPCLPPRRLAWLRARVDGGIDAREPAAAVTGALLPSAVPGWQELVPGESILALARAACARGDDHGAQVLLEEALHADPADEPCCRELLALYARRADRAGLEAMRARLLGRRVALADLWDSTAASLPAAPGAT